MRADIPEFKMKYEMKHLLLFFRFSKRLLYYDYDLKCFNLKLFKDSIR